MERRNFLLNFGGIVGGLGTLPFFSQASGRQSFSLNINEDPAYSRTQVMQRMGKPLKVKPLLLYELREPVEAASYRSWGGLITQADVDKEEKRINQELKQLETRADFSVSFQPLLKVDSDGKAREASQSDCDVFLLYAAGDGRNRINMVADTGKPVVMFLRFKTGPVYLWYEIVHPRLLRQETDQYVHPRMDVEDVVVDDYNEVLIRLRALYGLENLRNTTMLAINGIGGWGSAANRDHAKNAVSNIWHMTVKTAEMGELQALVEKKLNDRAAVKKAHDDAGKFLSQKFILSVDTERRFIDNAFILFDAFKEMMESYGAEGITVNGCMGIGKYVPTTACLAFSLINDEGLLAFCESDFVVIPSGVLLRHIAGKPVFLNDPTLPNKGITTCAHCHSPLRMNGKDMEPTHILTHFESDYGAAPKVEYSKGQVITNIIPDFESKKWVGFRGVITDHPFYKICRSQFNCTIEGDWEKLLKDMRGFHWMTCYGDYLPEMTYAANKVGIEFENISKT
jgi:hypothetical protein